MFHTSHLSTVETLPTLVVGVLWCWCFLGLFLGFGFCLCLVPWFFWLLPLPICRVSILLMMTWAAPPTWRPYSCKKKFCFLSFLLLVCLVFLFSLFRASLPTLVSSSSSSCSASSSLIEVRVTTLVSSLDCSVSVGEQSSSSSVLLTEMGEASA